MGLGTDSVVSVPTDTQGRMLPEELDKAASKARSEVSVGKFSKIKKKRKKFSIVDPLKNL